MAVAIFTPATGQLPAAAGVLFTFPADGFINVELVGGATIRRCRLYLNTGTRRLFLDVDLAVRGNWPGAAGRPYGPIFGKSGNTIDGDAAAASEIDYVITGASL